MIERERKGKMQAPFIGVAWTNCEHSRGEGGSVHTSAGVVRSAHPRRNTQRMAEARNLDSLSGQVAQQLVNGQSGKREWAVLRQVWQGMIEQRKPQHGSDHSPVISPVK